MYEVVNRMSCVGGFNNMGILWMPTSWHLHPPCVHHPICNPVPFSHRLRSLTCMPVKVYNVQYSQERESRYTSQPIGRRIPELKVRGKRNICREFPNHVTMRVAVGYAGWWSYRSTLIGGMVGCFECRYRFWNHFLVRLLYSQILRVSMLTHLWVP